MMNVYTNNILGLFELDMTGTVKYSRTSMSNIKADDSTKFIGRNFFDEVAPFKNVDEFRRRFRYFAQGSESAAKFDFTLQFDERPLEVKVLLTQICEREYDSNRKLIIVDIRESNRK